MPSLAGAAAEFAPVGAVLGATGALGTVCCALLAWEVARTRPKDGTPDPAGGGAECGRKRNRSHRDRRARRG